MGTAAFDDVHVGHDLDSTNESRSDGRGHLQHFLQCTVNTEANANAVFTRFDVHVRGAVTHGLRQDAVDDLHDWRVFGHQVILLNLGDGTAASNFHRLEHLHEAVDTFDGLVVGVDGPSNVADGCEQKRD